MAKKKNRNRQQGGTDFESNRQQSQQTGPESGRQSVSENTNRQPRNDRNQQQ